jgi:hypothetical protein
LKSRGPAHYVDYKSFVATVYPWVEWDATMPAVSLTDLQQQIAARERELQALRQELETRQGHLTELTRRKEELQSQLRQVEEEIAALAAGTAAPTEQATPATPAAPPAAPAGGQPRLGELIVTMLRESSGPMTARQLSEEARRRGFQPAGRDPVKSVEARVQELKSKGVVQRASDQPGYILGPSANGARKEKNNARHPAQSRTPKRPSKPAKPEPAAKKSSGTGSPSAGAARMAKLGRRGEQPPLRVVLTDILKKSRKPLSGSELAQRALAAGYKTQSTKFVDSVWTALGQMDNVEHLPQQGYRLKKK